MKKFAALALVVILVVLAAAPALALMDLNGYATARFSKSFPVYSGPGTNYFRANDGKATYGGNSTVRVFGVTGDWILMGYGMSGNKYRVGYISADALDYIYELKGDLNYNLSFSNDTMYTIAETGLSDDPVVTGEYYTFLPANKKVTALGTMGNWTYIEVKHNNEKQRGFVYTNKLKRGESTATQEPYYDANIGGSSLLASLKHNCPNTGVMLPEKFDPEQTHYLLTVADWVARPTFTPVAEDPNAKITINGKSIRSGQTYQGINMTDDPQAVVIEVTNGKSTTTYTIYLQRRPSEKRTRVSAGSITRIYQKGDEWRLTADLGTVTYFSDDYSTGSDSSYNNKTVDKYDYKIHPNCLFYYGSVSNPQLARTVYDFQDMCFAYGGDVYTIIYIEDEIVAVMPYGMDDTFFY